METQKACRLGVFSPDPDSNDVQLFGRVFGGGSYDRIVLRMALSRFRNRYAQDPSETRCIAVFAVDPASGQRPGLLQTA